MKRIRECESCAENGDHGVPAVGHSENPEWSGYWLCEQCIHEYNGRPPVNQVIVEEEKAMTRREEKAMRYASGRKGCQEVMGRFVAIWQVKGQEVMVLPRGKHLTFDSLDEAEKALEHRARIAQFTFDTRGIIKSTATGEVLRTIAL